MQNIKNLLFKNEAVIGINKPTDYLYLKILRIKLMILGAWPGNEIGENQSKYMVLVNVVQYTINIICLTGITLYIKIHSSRLSFYELGHMYITLFMGIVTGSRLIFTGPQSTKYRNVVSIFLTKMHLFFVKDVSDYAMKIHKQVHLISHLFTLYLTGQMFGGLLLFNSIPMWSNYATGKFEENILYNRTYEHAVYIYLPIKSDTHFNAYLGSISFEWFISYLCSSVFCMLDLLLSLMVFHLWGHYKILLHDLESFPLPGNKNGSSINAESINCMIYSENELKQISKKLKECICYHRVVSNFTDQMSETFGSMLLIYYAFHQVSGCLLLLECSQMTTKALMRYTPLTLMVFQQLIQISVIFELIGTTSEKLKNAVYGVPWQYMDTKNMRLVIIFLINVQEPVHVKALGVVDVGVTSMATILKTSMSYFMFLNSNSM